VRVEDLIGKRVVALNGRRIGHLEEIRANSRFEVQDVLLGAGALLERLSAYLPWRAGHRRTLVVRWDQIDLTDPQRLRLTCAVDEIRVEWH
jgi:hypothetical protein